MFDRSDSHSADAFSK